MITGIDVNQRVEFSISSDTEEPKTIFIARPLTASEMMSFSSDNRDAVEKTFGLLEKSIVEVRNYAQSDKPIKDILRTLPIIAINELSLKIAEINHLNDLERKNS